MARRWNKDFLESSSKKCINIFRNGDFENGKLLHVEPDWTFQDFLNAASQRLQLDSTAKRIYSIDGVEIDDCMMIEDNDNIFLCTDEKSSFIKNVMSDANDVDSSISSIIGSYRVGQFLGKGGFGEVRVGEHQVLFIYLYIYLFIQYYTYK